MRENSNYRCRTYDEESIMLIQFNFKNFKSFRDEVSLDLTLKFGKEPAQSLEIWALSRFVYIGYTVLFGGKLKKFLVA